MSSGVLPRQKASLGSGFPSRDQWPEPYHLCLEKLRLMGKAGSSLALPVLGCDLGNGPHNQAGEEPPPWSDVFSKDTDLSWCSRSFWNSKLNSLVCCWDGLYLSKSL